MVLLTPAARRQLDELPIVVHQRVRVILERLESWPDVSGATPLRGRLAGRYRIRTGDYRVIFRIAGATVTVWKIGYRGGVYD